MTLYTTHVHRSSLSFPSRGSTARIPRAPVLPGSLFYSPAERRLTAAVAVSDVSSLAEVSPPRHLRLVPQPPRASTARPGSPRARATALGRVASPPREVEPALPGRRVVPAPAASLSSLARPLPPPAPLQARGGVALPVEGRGGPVAPATGLPPPILTRSTFRARRGSSKVNGDRHLASCGSPVTAPTRYSRREAWLRSDVIRALLARAVPCFPAVLYAYRFCRCDCRGGGGCSRAECRRRRHRARLSTASLPLRARGPVSQRTVKVTGVR